MNKVSPQVALKAVKELLVARNIHSRSLSKVWSRDWSVADQWFFCILSYLPADKRLVLCTNDFVLDADVKEFPLSVNLWLMVSYEGFRLTLACIGVFCDLVGTG